MMAMLGMVSQAANYTNYFVPGTKWTTEFQSIPWHEVSYQTVWLEGGANVFGSRCMLMHIKENDGKESIRYVKVEEGKIYYHAEVEGEWELMYDFELKVGDRCYLGYPHWNWTDSQTKHHRYIENTGYSEIEGIPVMNVISLYQSSESKELIKDGEGSWLLGIGSTDGVLQNCNYGMVGGIRTLVKVESNGTVVYDRTSGLKDVEFDGVTVRCEGRDIIISGLDNGALIEVYSITGVIVAKCQCTTGSVNVKVDQPGIYFVKAGTYTRKILVK